MPINAIQLFSKYVESVLPGWRLVSYPMVIDGNFDLLTIFPSFLGWHLGSWDINVKLSFNATKAGTAFWSQDWFHGKRRCDNDKHVLLLHPHQGPKTTKTTAQTSKPLLYLTTTFSMTYSVESDARQQLMAILSLLESADNRC